MAHSPARRPRRGFTLIELLVVVAILGTAVVLIVPALQNSRESARKATCVQTLKGLMTATQSASGQLDGQFPALNSGVVDPDGNVNIPVHARGHRGGMFLNLLPYIGQSRIYQRALTNPEDPAEAFLEGSSGARIRQVNGIKQFQCMSDATLVNGFSGNFPKEWAGASYGANHHLFGGVRSGTAETSRFTLGGIPDGASNTIAFAERVSASSRGKAKAGEGERYGNCWARRGTDFLAGPVHYAAQSHRPLSDVGSASDANYYSASSSHPKTIHVVMADSSVRTIETDFETSDVDKVWRNLWTPDDGKIANVPRGPTD